MKKKDINQPTCLSLLVPQNKMQENMEGKAD